MRSLNLDSLLGERHQHATFHDAQLLALNIDFAAGSAKLQFLIPCGFLPSNELNYHLGTLELSGLVFYGVEPASYPSAANDKSSLWITSDGSLADGTVELGIELPSDFPDDAFAHYFYSSTTNSFIVIGAMQGAFEWK